MSSFPTPDFGVVAEVYDEVRPADGHWREIFELLVAEAGLAQGRMLDVGCGTGRLIAALAERGIDASGVDYLARDARRRARKLPQSTFAEAPAERLPFPEAAFDRLVFGLVVHLIDRPAAFAEAYRALAPGGTVAIVTFDRSHFAAYYLQEYFPSIRAIDEQRFPDEETLCRRSRQLVKRGRRVPEPGGDARVVAARRSDRSTRGEYARPRLARVRPEPSSPVLLAAAAGPRHIEDRPAARARAEPPG